VRQLIAPLVSVLIIAALWWRVDVQALWQAMQATNLQWLALAILALAPLILASAQRFRLLCRASISLTVAVRLTLSAAALNLFLPSKLGDLAKSWLLVRRHAFRAELALAIVVLERILDLAALLFWGVAALLWTGFGSGLLPWLTLGLMGILALLIFLMLPLRATLHGLPALARVMPGRIRQAILKFSTSWEEVVHWFWSAPRRGVGTILYSLLLWGGHLVQFWLLARAVGPVPVVDSMSISTLCILAGLLPFTIAGIGTRDAAVVLFFQPWLTPAQGALLGVLTTLRYIVPAIAGLPFVRDFWNARHLRQEAGQ
jgi:uncharacterized protein (TIRG00374 family)